jgi:hypothetical protein
MKPSQLSSAYAGQRKVSILEKKKNDHPTNPSLDLCRWVGREEGRQRRRYVIEATHTH